MSRLEQEFVEFDRRGEWPAVYMKIKLESASQYTSNFSIKDAKKPENRGRNRYRDVSPYDHSRVKLKKDGIDYINANLIKVPVADRSYILTQGPLPSTCGHFWLMVWEQNSKAVLMLNRLIEKGQLKCHKYYPAGEENGDVDVVEYEDVGLKVTYVSEDDRDHFTIRTLQLTNTETGEAREVLHFHYTTWPDFGVPHSPSAFLSFLLAVRESGALELSVGPPVIHCSAGIGRSGTFCLVDSSLVLIEREQLLDAVDIRQLLMDMRQYRMGLIQTPDQLRFSYLAVIEQGRALLGGPETPNSTFRTPMNRVPPPKPPRLQREYGMIEDWDSPIPGGNKDSSRSAQDGLVRNAEDSYKELIETNRISNGEEEGEDPPPLPPRKRPHVPGEEGKEMNNGPTEQTEESQKRQREETEVRRRNREARIKHTAEMVDRMKRKQQSNEKWRRRRSIVRPVLIGLAVSACVLGYLVYRYYSGGSEIQPSPDTVTA